MIDLLSRINMINFKTFLSTTESTLLVLQPFLAAGSNPLPLVRSFGFSI
jgi:hypothetical protein